eukprot:jgi/Galph1/2497/GphlegSOOS_G1151.1
MEKLHISKDISSAYVVCLLSTQRKDGNLLCPLLSKQNTLCHLSYRRQVVLACTNQKTSGVRNNKIWTVKDFDALLNLNELKICLIGMSNCGKSLRSKQLEESYGFERVGIDDKIEEQVVHLLKEEGYEVGIEGVAKWMGYPFEKRFYKNQTLYLQYENKFTYQAAIEARSQKRSVVLDTTGSVIYLETTTLQLLSDTFLIIHLEASEEMLQEMIGLYFEAPKPVIWGDAFEQEQQEDGYTALRRCYPKLLRYRLGKYQKLAHVSVPANISMNPSANLQTFVESIRQSLKKNERRNEVLS